jgi:hypothetical protein
MVRPYHVREFYVYASGLKLFWRNGRVWLPARLEVPTASPSSRWTYALSVLVTNMNPLVFTFENLQYRFLLLLCTHGEYSSQRRRHTFEFLQQSVASFTSGERHAQH